MNQKREAPEFLKARRRPDVDDISVATIQRSFLRYPCSLGADTGMCESTYVSLEQPETSHSM